MKKISLLLFVFLGLTLMTNAQNEARLLRFPATNGTDIVFSYAGDLYSVDKTGGVARKLTTDEGYEVFPRFSPDGKQIAFTAQYDGNTEVYLIPSDGGIPKRLTITATLGRDDIADRMGPNNIVMTWKNNNEVVYRSRKKSFNSFKGQLYLANTQGGLSQELPFPVAGFCSFSPDGKQFAYNRVFREFRTWKYYKGGMADDIWIYDFDSKSIKNITNNDAQDIMPMWAENKVYFISDRDRIMNLFCYDLDTKETIKLTNFTEFDIKFPSLGPDAIVFENGGYIYRFDLSNQKAVKVPIQIANDFTTSRKEIKNAGKLIRTASMSPSAKRIAFGARGDIFTVPVNHGITRNISSTSGTHERSVSWSPNGKYIAFISDASGEDEIYIQVQDGSEEPIMLTKKADTYKFRLMWSPDSKNIIWSGKKQRLQYVNINSKKITLVAESKAGEFNDYCWSPDSKWISYIKAEEVGKSGLYLYEVSSKKSTRVSSEWFDVNNPVFSADGKYLYFTSARDFNPTYSWTEWNHSYTDMYRIYFLTLAEDTPSPLEPENDEVEIEEEAEESGDKKEKKKEENSEDISVDLDGIQNRIGVLPISAAYYYSIYGKGTKVYYSKYSAKKGSSELIMFDFKKKKETVLGKFGGFDVSHDGKKMLLAKGGKYYVINMPSSPVKLKTPVDVSNMQVWVNVKSEWKQIFDESWRQMRDFFYDPNMHGVDWESIHKKYEPLVKHVNHRNDLTYIIGEMIGELNCGHAYVGGGDRQKPERIKLGLLGAELSKHSSGYFRIDHILPGENWDKKHRSPLTEIGVNAKVGEYIVAVNGKSTKDMSDIYESLIGMAGKQVELSLNTEASEKGARDVIVLPIAEEGPLYYYQWVQNNIKKVSEATNGQVGYIHIPDMGVGGLNTFVKYFYPQLDKKAIIIDDRGNGGGNVSPMIIERLSRELALMKVARNSMQSKGPEAMIIGPKVCLIDQYSASDGDLFPYQFKTLKLGKVIGVRSWGGVVGIRGSLPFIDGGTLSKPEFAHYDREGKEFIIEGYGVDPDIVIQNDPARLYNGVDDQLNKAIEVILEEMKKYDLQLPPIPPYPDKTK